MDLSRLKRFPVLRRLAAAAAALGLGAAAAALLIRAGLGAAGLIAVALPFSLLAGALAGAGPGLLALAAFPAIFRHSLPPPDRFFRFNPPGDLPLAGFFLLAGAAGVLIVSRLRAAALRAEEETRRARLMCRLVQGVAGARGAAGVLAAAREAMEEVMSDRVGFFLPRGETGLLELRDRVLVPVPAGALPRRVLDEKRPAGRGTPIMGGEDRLCLPLLSGEGRVLGAMEVRCGRSRDCFSREKRDLLEAMARQVAAALGREESAESGQREILAAEEEKLRSSLLRSLSHDFRTPLAGIVGAAEYLLNNPGDPSSPGNRELLANIHDEAAWLARMQENILSLTRFDSENVALRKVAEAVEEVVGSALRALSLRLADYPVTLRFPDTVLMVPMESVLIEQVLINLLDNAMKYSDRGSPIEVSVEAGSSEAVFEVADRGRGLPPEDLERIFEKFDRGGGGQTRGIRGSGLGLSICRAIVEAHGGRIRGFPRDGGGARFLFTLPLEVDCHG